MESEMDMIETINNIIDLKNALEKAYERGSKWELNLSSVDRWAKILSYFRHPNKKRNRNL
jgi:hypothetical protein